jgi:hypothetical protein
LFYDTSSFRQPLEGTRDDRTHAIVVLVPSESKRLIAKAVLKLPEVRRALDDGLFIVSRGITPSFIVEELGVEGLDRPHCTSGVVTDRRLGGTVRQMGPWVFRQGKLVQEEAYDVLQEFKSTDVSIKGANAVDIEGNAGILVGNEAGGTIGSIWPTLTARGSYLIMPVGLEKLIPSVIDAAMRCGTRLFKYAMGSFVGLNPVVNALVVTEVEAIEILAGVTATHVSSGGVGGSEGAVILALEGDDNAVLTAFEIVESIKGEPATAMPEIEPAVRAR